MSEEEESSGNDPVVRKHRAVPTKHNSHQPFVDHQTRKRVLWVVVVVWATNFFAGVFIADYKPDPQVHAVFMIVAGAIFAADVGRRRNGGDEEA